jgi:hypothetical protein
MPDRYGEVPEEPRRRDPRDIAECELCDEKGYRGHYVCDHIDHAAAAKRGMELIRQVLRKPGQ